MLSTGGPKLLWGGGSKDFCQWVEEKILHIGGNKDSAGRWEERFYQQQLIRGRTTESVCLRCALGIYVLSTIKIISVWLPTDLGQFALMEPLQCCLTRRSGCQQHDPISHSVTISRYRENQSLQNPINADLKARD